MTNSAPENVVFLYREVGRTHVFSSTDIKGFVHIGSHSLEKAFNVLRCVLHRHVKETYGAETVYWPNVSFEDFSAALKESNRTGDYLLTMSLERTVTVC